MNITIIQNEPKLFNQKFNFESILSSVEHSNSDIIVFPELSTSGYFFQNRNEVAENAISKDDSFFDKLQTLSRSKNQTICLGFPEFEIVNGVTKLYNSAALIFPNPQLKYIYRKTHLFYKERYCFDEGNTGFNVIYDKDKNINIGVMICYDWRFPEAARTLALKGADIILCPSNLVTELWTKVMPARAIENKVFLAVANRVGSETIDNETLIFNGKSAFYDTNGNLLTSFSDEKTEVQTIEFNHLESRNKKFNSINDIFEDRRVNWY